MMTLISLLLILFGFYILYLCSEKQRAKTAKSKWSWWVAHLRFSKIFAFVLFALAIVLLCLKQGTSIGWVSFFIFSTPLIFILILYCNDLKPKTKIKS